MKNVKNNGYVWGAFIAVLIIAAFVIFRANKAVAPSPATGTNTNGTSTVDLGNGVTATLPPGVTLKETDTPITGSVKTPAPSLNQQVTYSPSLSPDVVATLKTDIATLDASLKADSSQTNKWLQLAMYYKTAGDYPLAEQVWVYLTKVAPSSSIAYADLGDLYNSFIVNYPKAETNYLQAIKLKPDDINTYRNLFMLYRYQYKTNTTAAADILAQGLKANPNNPDLLQLQKQ